MFFKNAIIYQITESMQANLANAEALLSEQAFVPCKSQELSRYGWIAPCGSAEQLAFIAQGSYLIKAQLEEKIIPGSVVNRALKDKVSVIEKQEGRKIYSREKLELKDEIILDLLPRAFSKHTATQALIMPEAGLIIVDASTHVKAETLLNLLRNSFGSLPVKLPDTNHSPSVIMSQWVNQDDLNPAFKCLERCQLNDQSGEGAIIRVTGQDLQCDEITMHLDAGKQVVSLQLEYDELLSFVLNEDLSIKQIKPSDSFAAEMNEESSEDPAVRFEANLILMSGAFSRLAPQLFDAFGGLVAARDETA